MDINQKITTDSLNTMEVTIVPEDDTKFGIRPDISSRSQESRTFALELPVVGMLVFVAVCFNVIVIVTSRAKWRKSPNLFLVVLAATDIYNSLVLSAEFVMKMDVVDSNIREVFGAVRQSVVYFGTACSSFLVLCVTTDRFVRISQSKQHGLSSTKCIIMVLCSFIASAIISVPFSMINFVIGQNVTLPDTSAASIDEPNRYEANVGLPNSTLQNPSYSTEIPDIQISRSTFFSNCFLVFHIVVALQVVLAFVCIIIASMYLIYVVIKNRNAMNKHRQSALKNICSIANPGSSNSPSDSGVSSDDTQMSKDEFKQKLSETIAAQITERDKFERLKSSTKPGQSATSKHRSSYRTICLLLIATLLYMFNLPAVCMNILQYILPSVHISLCNMSVILYDFLGHSYIICFVFNPVLYTFFNRGFEKSLRKACCCHMKLCRVPSNSMNKPFIKQKGRITELNPRVWYPADDELETILYRETAV